MSLINGVHEFLKDPEDLMGVAIGKDARFTLRQRSAKSRAQDF
jgi:hypothetical protein